MNAKKRTTVHTGEVQQILELLRQREYSSIELQNILSLSRQKLDGIISYMTNLYLIYEYNENHFIYYGLIQERK